MDHRRHGHHRRSALRASGGFDERFPRAFREDADLALRTVRLGYAIVWGERVTTHPLASSASWRSSLKAQAGNADNALLRAKYGRRWRSLIGTLTRRTGRHLLTTASATAALAAWPPVGLRHPGSLGPHRGGGWMVWAGLTAEFAVGRILPGPRTAREISTVVVTSALIRPSQLRIDCEGSLNTVGRADGPELGRQTRAVLFDRDGTLIEDVPYLADPQRVRPCRALGAR